MPSFIERINEKELETKCYGCSNYKECEYKQHILRNVYEVNKKREKIIKAIKKWREQPWILNREDLIKKVENYVIARDAKKDILILSMLTLGLGVFIIILLLKHKNLSNDNANNSIISTIIPTVAIIIGMIVNYKTKFKEEK